MPENNEILDIDSIVLGLEPVGQIEAIERVGAMLVDRGAVDSSYVDSMKAREETMSTYLGNGIALPHGTYENKAAIKGTALAINQYPDGVLWGDEKARLVIGLAAQGDDHVKVLSQLARVLEDEDICDALAITTDAQHLLETLTAEDEEDDE